MRRGPLSLLAGALVLGAPSAPVAAQTPPAANSEAARLRARKLGEEGLALYDQGEYEAALAKLDEAEKLVDAPTLGLFAARCLAHLDRPVEAAERYTAVVNATLPTGASAVLRRAREEAEVERTELLRRIPRLRVDVRGPAGARASVEIDGRRADAAALDEGIALNPGPHRLVATSGSHRVESAVTLEDGEVEHVVLDLRAVDPGPARAPMAVSGDSPEMSLRTFGWIGIGVGGAAMSVWSIAGLAALDRAGDLGCESGTCRGHPDDVDGLNATRMASAIGFWTGLVALGAGAVLVITAPPARAAPATTGSRARTAAPATGAWIGPGSVGLVRRF